MVVREPPARVDVVIAVAKEVTEPVVEPSAFVNADVYNGNRPS